MSEPASRGARRFAPGGWLTPRLLMFSAAATLALIGAVLFATAPDPAREAAPEVGAAGAAVDVVALEIRAQPLERLVRKDAVIEARRRLELISETTGRVVALGAQELDLVAAEQEIVRVDPTLAESALERAEAAVARAESELDLAGRNLARWGELADRDAGSLSRRDDGVNAERVARANLREARAQRLEARDGLAKKTIAAPFAGVLSALPVEIGEVLHLGKTMGELLDLSAARLRVGLTDREIALVTVGDEADVQVGALPGERFQGEVLRVAAAAEEPSKKFPVEVEVPNSPRRLLPGMVASVVIRLGEAAPARLIPQDASVEQHGLRFVYVLERSDGDGIFRARRRQVEVRAVPFRPADYEVVSGVEDGEWIAGSRVRDLSDGALVRVRGGPA
jgi:RND family efflux transporter MFP subunit